jgi:hypothetical protein
MPFKQPNRGRNTRINQKSSFDKPRLILAGTFIVWVLIAVDSISQHNQLITTVLLSVAIWTAGLIGFKTTSKPGEFTQRVRDVGFWRALFSSGKNTSNVNSRRRRNRR